MILGGVGLAALLVAFWWLRPVKQAGSAASPDTSIQGRGSRPSGEAGVSTAESRAANEPANLPEPPGADFMEARTAAVQRWEFELETRLRQCLPAPSSQPRPLPVGFLLVHDARLSTPAVQRFVVMGVNPMDPAGQIPAEVRGCLGRAVGTTANLELPADAMPAGTTELHQVVTFPL